MKKQSHLPAHYPVAHFPLRTGVRTLSLLVLWIFWGFSSPPARAEGEVPTVETISIAGATVWSKDQLAPPTLRVGDIVTLRGVGFGAGPDVDYSKIMLGNTRVLERDLPMYQGAVNLIQHLFFEKPRPFDGWPKDLLAWRDNEITFRVPATASRGPLQIQVQKRVGNVPSLAQPGKNFLAKDPLTERVSGITPKYDVVSRVDAERTGARIVVTIVNPAYEQQRKLGEAIFWAYDFNIGLVHKIEGLEWSDILSGKTIDPVTGRPADPQKLFGAIPVRAGEVPAVASQPSYFDPYPIPMPIKPLLRPSLKSGAVAPTGYVGFTYAESIHPVKQTKGSWSGMNCASCHAQRITYEDAPGHSVSKVFPGLPNPDWTMRWTLLGDLRGVKGKEVGPDGQNAYVDKSLLLYAVPAGAGEHTLVRAPDGSLYGNDSLFSPRVFPIVTRHTPLRRSLSHTEMYAGFEGSYIHSEEPDGAIGAMRADALKAFTVYMSTLDENDETLNRVGLYRWLKQTGNLGEINQVGEGTFVKNGGASYPDLSSHLERGKQTFKTYCLSCHQYNQGTWTNEDLMPFTEVGTYFSPTLFQRKSQAIRTDMIRNLYWTQKRGLLHDGHVKSIEDLVNPERCREGSPLYNAYYTLNPQTFKVRKGNAAQERALRRHAYFSDVSWDKENLYWDYQRMRREFGPREFGAPSVVKIPASPHPWCVGDAGEISDLVQFLMTL